MNNQATISAPAPWALIGSGYIILLKLSRDFVETYGFVPDSLKGSFTGGFGTVMYVDYIYSDVGPYQELLFIPGTFGFMGKNFFSITKIFVSTLESVVNGQNNWGIPKELAEFERESTYPSTECIRIIKDGSRVVELSFRSYNLRLPVTTGLVPPAWRTLAHHHEGKTFITTPVTRGSIAPARLVDCNIKESFFPGFTQGRVISAFKVPHFFMVFPKARLRSG